MGALGCSALWKTPGSCLRHLLLDASFHFLNAGLTNFPPATILHAKTAQYSSLDITDDSVASDSEALSGD